MATVIVIGAGLGGMSAAYELKAELGKQHDVILVNDKPDFEFTPSNPWIAVQWRERKEISIPIEPYVKKKGIQFVHAALTKLEPTERQISLSDGQTLRYDFLVLCTGPALAFEEVTGAGPDAGGTTSVCTLSHAEECRHNVTELIEHPGPVIVGAMPGASCFGPAYEYAFILDRHLRDKKVRKHIPMTFVTSEPYIGHLGLNGVGDSKGMLESELRMRDIHWICNARTVGVKEGMMIVEELDEDGNIKRTHQLPYHHAMMLPAFKGIAPLRGIEGLVNPRGFVIVDEFQRNPVFNEIYSAGVCIAIPPQHKTPVPTGVPKTGYMIEAMVRALSHNIKAEINGTPPTCKAVWNAICLADMGDTGAAFVAMPQIPPRNVAWFKKGKWVHLAKIAFEKYFLHKMQVGDTEPLYEKLMLKYLGIDKIE
ncbi:sulfide:quinone oxidoreductase [Aeromonas sp. RU39B]|uniref:NAD(P)/FAD-dependent oxidoreductase n=1 Tax=Aeromonas sp. RU39B TaxID=1907416 RepID=UPI0009557175|nr:FAD/NAD(P)-binding oxidoreductase [Aeromonas sp. RU39B]SIR41324.1 sulfide:quinone oxidoreductase [Aeromonas sp. RU39B]